MEERDKLGIEVVANSTNNIIPFIIDICNPQSVVDVGCGNGTWLETFISIGIEDVLGIDEAVASEELRIPTNKYMEHSLTEKFKLDRSYDLVISLEVRNSKINENISTYVENLTSLGKMIVFAAPIPFENGKENNGGKWTDFWIKRFEERNYGMLDVIRPIIWGNAENHFSYNQNMLLFVEKNYFEGSEELRANIDKLNTFNGECLVHPELYISKVNEINFLYKNMYGKMFEQKKYEDIYDFVGGYNPYKSFYIARSKKEQQLFQDGISILEDELNNLDNTFKISSLYHIAESYYFLEKFEEAIKYFEQCLELSSGEHRAARRYIDKLKLGEIN